MTISSSFSRAFLRSQTALAAWRAIPRCPDQKEELKRLCQDPFIQARVKKARKLEYYDLSDSHLNAYGRVLEVFQTFQNTHYVFSHGQPTTRFVGDYLLNQKLLSKDKEATVFETVLRHPASFPAKFMRGKTVSFYRKQITKETVIRKSDYSFRELLPADAFLSTQVFSESALTAFSYGPSNMESISRVLHGARREIASSLHADETNRDLFLREVHKLTPEDTEGGILFAVCVPKDFFPKCGYLSRPLGIPLLFPEADTEVLDDLQKGKVRLYSNGKISPSQSNIPQVRLLSHKLHGKKGVSTFMFPTMQDHALLDLSHKVETLIEGMHSLRLK